MNNRKRVAFHTLGCKLNYTETGMIWKNLESLGYEKVSFESPADYYIINTCSVTENADKECKRIVRKAQRCNPDSHIVVTGCYAQLKPNQIAEIPGVNLVVGTQDKFKLGDLMETILHDQVQVYSCDIQDVHSYHSSYSIGERTRTFLKVQDGCDYSCTYCTIPLARGKSRSDSIINIIRQANEIAQQGIKEIVLSGVNIGDFGFSGTTGKRNENLLELITELDRIEGIQRFRISSIEPNLLNDQIIEFIAGSKKFVPHFHIPLQSGSDFILKRMKRRYLSALYQNRIETIKTLLPQAGIGADVIVGFPGETEEYFRETFDFIHGLPLSYLHVFTYSERDNTEAVSMTASVPSDVRLERNRLLRQLSNKKRNVFYNEHLYTSRPVLWECENDGGYMLGYTDNYIRVRKTYSESQANTIQNELLIHTNGSEVYVRETLPVATA